MTSPHLVITLLGEFSITVNGKLVNFSGDRPISLLAYLLLNRTVSVSRQQLAFTLWPDSTDGQARTNLRNLLHTLRQALPQANSHLSIENTTLQWRPEADISLDVANFLAELATTEATHEPKDKIVHLETAVSLYKGDLLPGNYDDWIMPLREELRQQYLDALHQLVSLLEQEQAYRAATRYSQRLLQLDVLDERAYVQLMQLQALSGDRAGLRRTYETCVATLRRELDVGPSSSTRAAYEKLVRWEAPFAPMVTAAPSPTTSIPAQPRPLPQPTTSFIGREAEFGHLAELLADPNCRLLTIVGPGGIGKTRLALETANGHQRIFADGVVWVPLTSIANDTLLASAIAEALNLKFYGGKPPLEQLLNHLREQHSLLVLDNFEHLVSGADLLGDILQATPYIKMLVTSREKLSLQSEWLFELGGLSYPHTADLVVDSTNSSLDLFIQRAQQAQAGFKPSPEDLPAIIRVCQLVQGMPLGLELAAAWTPLMSCAEIVAEIERNLDFLATDMRDVPERHRSFRAVFRHSWQLLTPEEQAIYSQLSVFAGGFTREAVTQVTGASMMQLASLMGKSLLRRGANSRYEIHELLRQYAAEKLAESPTIQAAAYAAHAAYFTNFLHQRQPHLQGVQQVEAIQAITADFDNVRLCWQWLIDHQDAPQFIRAFWSLFEFCEMSGRTQDGYRLFRTAAQALNAWSEPTANEVQQQALALLLMGYGWLSTRVGKSFVSAHDLLQQSVTLLRPIVSTTPPDSLAQVIYLLGVASYFIGDTSRGWQLVEEALRLARTSQHPYTIGMLLQCLGQLAEYQGEFHRAEAYFQESAKTLRPIGEKIRYAYTLNNWGRTTYGLGKFAEADQLIQEGLGLRQQLNDLVGMAYSLLDLGKVAYLRGEYGVAEQQMQASLEIAKRIDSRDQMARVYNGLGWIALALNDLPQAQNYQQQSLTIFRGLEVRRALPLTLNSLAQAAIFQQDYGQARDYLTESLEMSQDLANVGDQASAQQLFGHTAMAEGNVAAAANHYQQALAIVLRTGAAPIALDICLGAARLYLPPNGDDLQKTADLLQLVLTHPATTAHVREQARKFVTNHHLPEAKEIGGLWSTVESLLTELTQGVR